MSNSNKFIAIGSVACLVGVATGAFGAHALEGSLGPEQLTTWEKGVDYLFVHALGLILLGILARIEPRKCLNLAAWLMVAGIVLFSGSLFVLVLSGIKWLGMITPLGGVSFLAAWLILAVCYLKADRKTG
jgi:uncharacterized membrane protein YgdD (TMEM256/DUF423 family)